jgi:teichuronic acid exporter
VKTTSMPTSRLATTESLRHKILHGLFWTGGTRLLGQCVTWLITLIVIRVLTPDDYGLLALASVFVSLLLVLSEAGLGAALVQPANLEDSKLRPMFAAVILLNSSFALLLLGAAPAIAIYFSDSRLASVIQALSVLLVLNIFTVIPTAILTRRLDFRRLSLVGMGAVLCGSLCTLALALSGYGVWSLIVGTLLNSAFSTVALNCIAPFFKLPDFSFRGTRSLFVFGGQVTGTRVLWQFYSQADVLIAGKMLGHELLGIYSVAMHLASLPVHKLAPVLNQVAFPAFARAQHDSMVSQYVLKSLRLVCFFAVPVLWGISSIAPEMVNVILGPNWLPALIPLQLLALVMPLSVVSLFLNSAFQGIGHGAVAFRNVVTASVILPPAFLVGAHWGLLGLSLAWVVAFPIILTMNLRRMVPLVGLRLTQVVAVAVPAALSGCGMYLAVMLTRYVAAPIEGSLRMCLLVVVGAATYWALSWIINRGGVRELTKVLRARLESESS